MFIPAKLASTSVVAVLCVSLLCAAQTKRAAPAASSMQEHYDAAQRAQQAGRPEEAATQYRAFLRDALERLAAGRARIGEYSRAASNFDEALALEPDSPEMRLEYARTALSAGDLSHAENLARAYLKDYPNDRAGLGEAHQILGRALLKANRDRDARKELEAAVALDPSFVNGYDLAVACLDLDDEKCAAQLFGEIETAFGDTAAIHMQFGRAYGNSDFQPQAIEEFRKVIAKDPRYPGAHYSLAATLLAVGDDEARVKEAEAELKKELDVSPKDFLTYAALGKIAGTHQRCDEAEKYLKRAIELNPKNPDAYLYLGQVYFDTERRADAETALRKAVDLTTDVSRNRYQIQKAHFLLGRILMQEHHADEAHSEMQIARSFANKGLSQDKGKLAGLMSESSGPDTSAESALAAEAGPQDVDPALVQGLSAFEKQLAPAIADSYNNLGVVAATGGNYEAALKFFERAAEWNPSLEGLDLNWGRAAFMASRFADAVPPIERYLAAHPGESGLRAPLAMSQFMVGNYSGCLAALGLADEATKAIPQMRYIDAESLVKSGQVAAGKDRLEALEKSNPEIAEVHRSLGEVHAALGERAQAMEELKLALRLRVDDSEAHYELGNVELGTGDAAGAIQELETAVRLVPREARYHEELAAAYKRASRSADAEKELAIVKSLTPTGGSAQKEMKTTQK